MMPITPAATAVAPHAPAMNTAVGLADRHQERLPVPSVPVGLTLPQARHERVRRPPQDLDAMWRRAVALALLTRAMDPHAVGGLMGVWGVLPPGPPRWPAIRLGPAWGRLVGAPPPAPSGGPPARPPGGPSMPSRRWVADGGSR